MKELYTTTFRNIARIAFTHHDTIVPQFSWTDKPYRFDSGNKRVVTFYARKNAEEILNEIKTIMITVGIDPDKFKLRLTYSGYIKCNCIKPGNILL